MLMHTRLLLLLLLSCVVVLAGIGLSRHNATQIQLPIEESVPSLAEQSTSATPHTSPSTAIESFSFFAKTDGTVEALMQRMHESAEITYVSKEYPTLGSFLESLQGIRNANGKYWMLSINGIRSSVGMSQAEVVAGDTIVWTYE